MGRRDATLYLVAQALGSFGLGVLAFYLNFLWRGLGFAEVAIGILAASQAIGVVLGAAPGARFAGGHSRRASLLVGGTITGAGVSGILLQDALPALIGSSVLLGAGGILVSSTGSALLADASRDRGRFRIFGVQIAIATTAAFFASAAAGALASPVAALAGVPESDPRAIRGLLLLGGGIAGLGALPVLAIHRAAVPPGTHAPAERRRLVRRFLGIEICWGFGAGSFLPFLNLFVVDRFGVPFAGLGLVLGTFAVAGALGAVLHGRGVVPSLGPRLGVAVTVLVSLPFALGAAAVSALPVAAGLLAARAALMYGSSASWTAYSLSSFTPAERAGAVATLAIAYQAASAIGSVLSGAARSALGDLGWTVNLATLATAYGLAALLVLTLFRAHEPAGDRAGAIALGARDSDR